MSGLFSSLRTSVTRRKLRQRRKALRCESLEARLMFAADMADLSALNDEFNDPATLEQWQLVSQVEGWGTQPFETFDIDQTNSDALTIAPHTSTWFQDYQGDLAFKEVAGDFIVTTHIAITDRDDIGASDADDVPNDSTFSLGGVMLRSPRAITDATTEWTPGGSNFVFLSLGHSYDGNMSLESKNTVNSVSNLELIPVNSTTAELRVERSGNSITTMYRLTDGVEWQVAANFSRPDMPDTLQVGLVGYTDYEKTSSFDPFYANSHTLIDNPENAANSSNPGLAYDPDVQARFDYIRFERPESETSEPQPPAEVTTEVVVVNPSFEDIAGETPFNEFTFGPLPGWDLYDPGNITSGGTGPQYYVGTLTPGEVPSEPGLIQNFPGGAYDGQRVAIAFNFDGSGDGGEYGIQQTLAATLQANTSYALSVNIGNIATGTAISGQTFFLDGLPGYRVELLAGDTVIASDNSSLSGLIAEGEFGESVVTFDAVAAHPQLGQPLGIRLVNLNQTAGVPAGNDLEVDFDNVRLIATSLAFAEIGDQQVHHSNVLNIPLPTAIADGTPIAYSVEIEGSQLWDLDQQYDLNAGGYTQDGTPIYYEDYQNYGVRWLQSDTSGWMFLQSDGTLHEWQGSIAASPEIASLGEEVFADPSLLHDAINFGTALLDGNALIIDPTEGFLGTFNVSLSKTAGELSASEVFAVEVTNISPDIPVIGDQSIATDEVLLVDLPTLDADGDVIAYEVNVIENIAADARDAFAIGADASLVNSDYGFNYLGQQERWVQSAFGWMFITTEGTLHQWTGTYATSPEVARLDARYHADPSLLINAEQINIFAAVIEGQLQVSVADGYVGEVHIRLSATDGLESIEQSFTIDLTAPAWASMVDDAFGAGDDWI
ncbi:MAG: hypothetical protein H6822_11845 [Planctomycetaceae bacterium]|nr:hypothetical protein [Planctomycetales bacterium]MCB9922869.1 hypothetical protein [Planctomycetaceae bacterium]